MLSRVAAVEAPRTHNRRRVAGSGGRRREGRESEPQRPHISRRVFASAVLPLVVMMCCGTGVAQGDGPPLSQEAVPNSPFGWRDAKGDETVSLLRVPGLVEIDGDVFAVAEAQCTKGDSGFTGIASELLTLTDDKPKENLDKNNLKTQVPEGCIFEGGKCPADRKENCACRTAGQDDPQSKTKVHVSRPTTVVNGNDIYMLAGNYSWAYAENDQAVDWGLMLVKGNVSNEDSNRRIFLNDSYFIPWNYKNKQHESLMRLIGSGGSGVKMKDGTLVFPVEGTKKDGKAVSLIIRSSDAKSWKLSNWMSADGCSDPSVVEWKDKKLMMMTACGDGRRRVYESADKGDSWTEALGTLSRVWGNKHKLENVKLARSGFITATIEDRDVMLVTLPVYSSKDEKETDNEKGVLHLWLTDNTHIVDIGPVSGEGDDEVASSSLLYKSGDNNELIALYEKKNGDEEESLGMVSVRLTEQLEKVKDVLATWKEVDETVSKLCATLLAEKDPSTDNGCSAVIKITDGLVGFLSGNFSDNTWRDEYLGVNATVKNGAAAHNGVTFKGRGAWAEWPVGVQGENQLYHFANYKFTLVATVSIDKVPEEGDTPIPLMGAKMKGAGNSVFLGLSYNNNGKKWILLCGDGTNSGEHSSNWESGTKRHVVILLRNGNQSSAYVDGQRVGVGASCALGSTESQEISHFYIGGDGGSSGSKGSRGVVLVTVTNVLLYNRPLTSEEIGVLNPNKALISPLKEEPSTPSPVPSASVVPPTPLVAATAQQTGNSSTPDGTHRTEQGQPIGNSGADSGSASASAASTVSIPSAEKDSVMQSASGKSSDGAQTVDGGSTADGDPTVEKREGTDAQKEEGIRSTGQRSKCYGTQQQ
ncbi:c71 surface protein, partial [Trypanosoma cruzi]